MRFRGPVKGGFGTKTFVWHLNICFFNLIFNWPLSAVSARMLKAESMKQNEISFLKMTFRKKMSLPYFILNLFNVVKNSNSILFLFFDEKNFMILRFFSNVLVWSLKNWVKCYLGARKHKKSPNCGDLFTQFGDYLSQNTS